MSSTKKNKIISLILIVCAIIFTLLVKIIDVQNVGVKGTSIGFASINTFIFGMTGKNMMWYKITKYLGLLPLLMAGVYGLIGLYQLIKFKDLNKVNKQIILLGLFYVCIAIVYIFFEKVIINYRPVLVDGKIEASYPSSHTLMSICVCVSSILINKYLFSEKIRKPLNIIMCLLLIIIVVGRLLSGFHWFTDIIGGILISSAMIMCFYTMLNNTKKKDYII